MRRGPSEYRESMARNGSEPSELRVTSNLEMVTNLEFPSVRFRVRGFRDSVFVENAVLKSRKKQTPVAVFAIMRPPTTALPPTSIFCRNLEKNRDACGG